MGICCTKKELITIVGNFEFTPPNWKKGILIGEGAYGKVYECLNLDTGELHAVKCIKLIGSPSQIFDEVKHLKQQISMLKFLSHPNIVQYIHAELDSDGLGVNILMEFVPGGSLRSLLNRFGKFDENISRLYVAQILSALCYIHSQGIVHRDIKAANILIDQHGLVKLSDFGASKYVRTINGKEELCRSLKGSPYWMAPEVANRNGHSFSADVWSVGCVMIEMLTGSSPWSNISKSVKEVLQFIVIGEKPPLPEDISGTCKEFIEACLKSNPADRPSAKDLLNFEYLTSFNWQCTN